MDRMKAYIKNNVDTYSLLRITCAILIAFACTIVIIFAFSEVPLLAMQKFFFGALTTKRNFFNVIETMTTAKLGRLIQGTQMHYGFIIMIIAFILVYILMEKTTFCYELKVVGANMKYAKYAGINVFAVVMLSQFIGGALAGMGGAIEILGIYDRFLWVSPVSFVWDAILINILAGEKTKNIPITAFFFAFIRVGAGIMLICALAGVLNFGLSSARSRWA